MKKVISLVLCTIMIVSLFAINTSAAVPMQKKYTENKIVDNDGDNKDFGNAAILSPSTAKATTITEGTNKVYELAFHSKGAYDGAGKYYVMCQYRDPNSNWYSDDCAFYLDVKPVNNTSGIILSIQGKNNSTGIGAILHFFPSNFTEDEWTTVKVLVEAGEVTVYTKAQGDPDSAFKKLMINRDYKYDGNSTISEGTSFYGLDSRYMDMTKVDYDNFMSAKYLIDNVKNYRFDDWAQFGRNFVYTDDIEIVVDTEAVGATGLEYKFAAAHDTSATTRSIVFDAVKTGGDRPISIVYAPKNGGSTFAFNIWNATQDVKYTYKVDYVQGSLTGISRKAEGSDTWEALTEGTDYSKGSIYGAWQYLKFGYLGTYYADKNDQAHLAEYCGPNPALDDINTRWTFSNFQITGYEPAISAIRSETATGHKYTVSAVAQSADYAVMIAVYDGETFAGAGVANFNHEGVAEVNVDHAVANPTFKAFIWNTADESAPMMAPIDITTWVE